MNLKIFRDGIQKLIRTGPWSTYAPCIVGNDVFNAGEVVHFINAANAQTVTGGQINIDELHVVPFIAPARGGLVSSIQCNFNTTGDQVRLGIYANVDNPLDLYPGKLLFESEPITIAVGELPARCSLSLDPGHLYWGAIVASATKTPVQCLQSYQCSHNLGIPSTETVNFARSLVVAHTFGALPATFPGGAAWSTLSPALKLRYAA